MERLVVLVCLVPWAMPSAAQPPQSADAVISLRSLNWLSGYWSGEEHGRSTEEFWLPPKGGVMLGANRVVTSSGKASFETVRIVEADGKLVYVASPSGGPSTSFVCKKCDTESVTFENLDHDFPQRIIYRRVGNQLRARIEGLVNGQTRAIDWVWTKQDQLAATQLASPGGRPMLQGLRTVVYKVEDLQKAKQWYSTVFEIEPYFDEPFYVGFNIGGYELGLDPDLDDVTRGNNQPAYWGVADCRKAFAQLLEKGARQGSEPQDVGGGIIVATVLDPFGNTIGVIENPHFKLEAAK